ncbi:ribosomal protection-like ABC-F family protein [Clostridium sp. KNHs214]|uniref:ribosomal protection-like ABC-F family protein n=1 Tax=Clostridium sp. KNHs214 TaxID=1540257 RepID=UPI0005572856|nr:ABC-F family ATP-binding cassette domain-containing protein [Clostridium sp. KNHs214]
MIELALSRVEKYYGANKILNNITFEVKTGEKVGIIGRNGSGKTTILKIISGIEKQDKGELIIKKGATLGYLDQIPKYPKEYTVLDVLKTAFERQKNMLKNMRNFELQMSKLSGKELDIVIKKYGELQQSFEHEGGYEMEENLSKVCTGLGITEWFKVQKFEVLSGGEKSMVILGKILLQNPDILLLDEPSNHLDMEAMEWLEEFLSKYKGIIVIVSHDRYFLDSVVTKVVEIEDMNSQTYKGNYSEYIKEKKARMILQLEAFEEQQKKIKAMEKSIKDLREWGKRGDNEKFFKRAESIQKRLDKISRIDKPILERDNMKITFNINDRSGKDVVSIEGLIKSFDKKNLFDEANMHIKYGERVAIIGKNGSGKSTLIKMLINEYSADYGKIQLGTGVNIGYLPQNIMFSDDKQNILEYFMGDIVITEGKARAYLARFMFYGESVFKKVKNLSGGEKSRLKLCKLMFNDINFLVLDEPTNHLDIDSRETLEQALLEFKGTILLISHDRYFINTLCNRIIELKNKKLVNYGGNYEYYREKRMEEKSSIDEENNIKKINLQKNNSKGIEKENFNKSKEKNVQYELSELEKKINSLENYIDELNNNMCKYSYDFEKLNEICEQKSILQKQVDMLMEEWINLA